MLPCDGTRVRVAHCQEQQGSDYINASHVSSKAGETPAWHYIATQVHGHLADNLRHERQLPPCACRLGLDWHLPYLQEGTQRHVCRQAELYKRAPAYAAADVCKCPVASWRLNQQCVQGPLDRTCEDFWAMVSCMAHASLHPAWCCWSCQVMTQPAFETAHGWRAEWHPTG